MARHKGLNIERTKAGKFFVRVLHKSFTTLDAAKRAIDRWERRQMRLDKPWK